MELFTLIWSIWCMVSNFYIGYYGRKARYTLSETLIVSGFVFVLNTLVFVAIKLT